MENSVFSECSLSVTFKETLEELLGTIAVNEIDETSQPKEWLLKAYETAFSEAMQELFVEARREKEKREEHIEVSRKEHRIDGMLEGYSLIDETLQCFCRKGYLMSKNIDPEVIQDLHIKLQNIEPVQRKKKQKKGE